jgi:NTP pyrophosphatase (non-canonical NTP hydrolase)
MTEHFNGLTPAEAERLAILAEEAGEIVQAVGKILRHGYESYNPTTVRQIPNRRHLEIECGDIAAVIHDMCRQGDMQPGFIDTQRESKLARLEAGTLYLHHQKGDVV